MLFAGTGNGFHYSPDDGKSWKPFKTGLPAAPVTWIEVQKRAHDVVVSTYGRGLYILRDITTLEHDDRTSTSASLLYAPRNGVREARSGSADFIYSMPEGVTGQVQFEILDQSGKTIRTWSVPSRAGLNRVSWDLRSDGPRQVALRTIPPDNPQIWEEARFKGRDTRPIIHWGIQNPQRAGAIAAPGRYSVRMTVAGQQQTKPFEVEKDPSLPSSVEDIAENTRVQQRIVGDINQTVDMVNQLEVMRKQIEDQMKAQKENAAVVKALTELDRKAMDVELQLLSRTELHSDDKWYVEAVQGLPQSDLALRHDWDGRRRCAGGRRLPSDSCVDEGVGRDRSRACKGKERLRRLRSEGTARVQQVHVGQNSPHWSIRSPRRLARGSGF